MEKTLEELNEWAELVTRKFWKRHPWMDYDECRSSSNLALGRVWLKRHNLKDIQGYAYKAMWNQMLNALQAEIKNRHPISLDRKNEDLLRYADMIEDCTENVEEKAISRVYLSRALLKMKEHHPAVKNVLIDGLTIRQAAEKWDLGAHSKVQRKIDNYRKEWTG